MRIASYIANPSRIFIGVRDRCTHAVVRVNNALRGAVPPLKPSGQPELDEVRERARRRSDISDHLVTLFEESLAAEPGLIVELGVRGGESTFVFERVARRSAAALVSVDLEPCDDAVTLGISQFVQSDDISFAGRFEAWCAERGIDPAIDILFIDTNHLYDHTVQEIESWFPHLSPRARVFFHDTNMRRVYRRRDGTLGEAWSNDRDVIRAIERYLDTRFDETRDFDVSLRGWRIRHHAICNGLTILERVADEPRSSS